LGRRFEFHITLYAVCVTHEHPGDGAFSIAEPFDGQHAHTIYFVAGLNDLRCDLTTGGDFQQSVNAITDDDTRQTLVVSLLRCARVPGA